MTPDFLFPAAASQQARRKLWTRAIKPPLRRPKLLRVEMLIRPRPRPTKSWSANSPRIFVAVSRDVLVRAASGTRPLHAVAAALHALAVWTWVFSN